jgi:hypothetical protein
MVEDYVHDFERFKGKRLEKLSLETVQGAELARLYGVVRYPAILVIGPEGVLQKMWQDQSMPLMDEVNSYLPSFDQDLAIAQMLSASS